MHNDRFCRDYTSPESAIQSFPSVRFYWTLLGILRRAGKKANAGAYSGDDWAFSSEEVGRAIERMGTPIHIEGFAPVRDLQGPCVFVSNHMSTLETFFLPCIIQPVRDVTFVVKESLLKYPFLGPVLKARQPLVVGRANPREDLAVVLEGGQQRLAAGRSVIIFPQGTRSHTVDENQFSSLGVKLARKAHVPVIPIALKTDAWGTGALIKDFGKINPRLPVHVKFGDPVHIEGNGKEEHARIVAFIKQSFDGWTQGTHERS